MFGPLASAMPNTSQMTWEQWTDGLLTALSMMNDTACTHTHLLATIVDALVSLESQIRDLADI